MWKTYQPAGLMEMVEKADVGIGQPGMALL